MKREVKKAQFDLSFGMIFSIILIVVFLAVAFVAIKAFLGVKCSTEQGTFVNNLRNDVTRIWKGAGERTEKNYGVSGCDFTHVCFYDPDMATSGEYSNYAKDFRIFTGDEGNHNLYFYPRAGEDSQIPSTYIDHINMDSLTKNPYCFSKVDDKITIELSKRLNEPLVSVS